MRSRLLLKSKQNEAGSTLVLVLIALGLIGVTSLAVSQWHQLNTKVVNQGKRSLVLEQIKSKLSGLVLSPISWQQTQIHNPSAFAPGSQPGLNSSQFKLDLYSGTSSTAPYYASSNSAAGFDSYGQPCDIASNPFSENGNNSCPYHYDVAIANRVVINGNTVETIAFTLKYRSTSEQSRVNEANYNFQITRNFDDTSVETSCISIGGSYSTESGRCSLTITQETSCASGSSYRGPASLSNSQSCAASQDVTTATCTTNFGVTGFDSNGTPICGPLSGYSDTAVNLGTLQ